MNSGQIHGWPILEFFLQLWHAYESVTCEGYVITHDKNILGHWEKSIKTHFKNFVTNFEYNGPLFFYYILQIVSTVTCDVYVTYDVCHSWQNCDISIILLSLLFSYDFVVINELLYNYVYVLHIWTIPTCNKSKMS